MKHTLTILIRIHWIILLPLILVLLPSNSRSKEKPFRPKVGEFPPLEKAHSYKGELTFVDHANRRGSLRIDGGGRFRFAAPSPFALLPYGLVRYHGSPADLRDIPLGTVMYAKAFLPPDPKTSSVPILPLDNREKNTATQEQALHRRKTTFFYLRTSQAIANVSDWSGNLRKSISRKIKGY